MPRSLVILRAPAGRGGRSPALVALILSLASCGAVAATAAPAAAASELATRAPAGPADEAFAFARSLAAAGARPAGSARERAGQRRAGARFRAAGLTVSYDRFTVPGRGRSRNVVAVRPGRSSCLRILMAHADSMPAGPGALDNASGVGLLVGLAPLVAAAPDPECETWLVATGAEERLYTGRPDHLGASALVRRLRRQGRIDDVRWALSLDEVGRDARFDLYSPAARPRRGVEDAVLRAATSEDVAVRWRRDPGAGNSDHRELALAGMPAMKLGVVDHACRHRACDRAGQLRLGAFRRVTRVVVRFTGLPAPPSVVGGRASVVTDHASAGPRPRRRSTVGGERPVDSGVRAGGFELLPLTAEHAVAAGRLPMLHRDPFDRALVAQARLEGLTVVTADRRVADYDVPVLPAEE